MIELLKNKPNYYELAQFFEKTFDYDFYITEDNVRLYMTNISNIRKFLKQTCGVYVFKDHGEYKGLIGVWKSLGGGKTRYYIKIAALNFDIAKNLLTVLLWNFEKDLYIKLRKDSQFVSAFKNKGFRFHGGRGCQILLYRKFIGKRIKHEYSNHDKDFS
jgi:hypothetical protein